MYVNLVLRMMTPLSKVVAGMCFNQGWVGGFPMISLVVVCGFGEDRFALSEPRHENPSFSMLQGADPSSILGFADRGLLLLPPPWMTREHFDSENRRG